MKRVKRNCLNLACQQVCSQESKNSSCGLVWEVAPAKSSFLHSCCQSMKKFLLCETLFTPRLASCRYEQIGSDGHNEGDEGQWCLTLNKVSFPNRDAQPSQRSLGKSSLLGDIPVRHPKKCNRSLINFRFHGVCDQLENEAEASYRCESTNQRQWQSGVEFDANEAADCLYYYSKDCDHWQYRITYRIVHLCVQNLERAVDFQSRSLVIKQIFCPSFCRVGGPFVHRWIHSVVTIRCTTFTPTCRLQAKLNFTYPICCNQKILLLPYSNIIYQKKYIAPFPQTK